MAASVLNAPHFQNEEAAFAYVEARFWPNGPVCPHCGNADASRIRKMEGKTTRLGLRKCNECRKPFTVRQNSIFESSHLALHLWLQVIHLMCASKKGISTRQIQRMLDCSMKTAWFLTHRIREAMRTGDLAPMGGAGTDVQVDETFIWSDKDKPPVKHMRGLTYPAKINVLSLVDRATGRAQSFVVDTLKAKDIAPILRDNIAKEARLVTDEATRYVGHAKMFAAHASVNHSKDEYVNRYDSTITTNHVEGYFSVFKRGMVGVYQHTSKEHLHRYLAEFDFRYSTRGSLGVNDVSRADRALIGGIGKRLTYQTIVG